MSESKEEHPTDPIDLRTSLFEPKEILYHHDNFVVAKGLWGGSDYCLACRWHYKDKLGYPNGFGKGQWMLLPGKPKDSDDDALNFTVSFEKELKEIVSGMHIKDVMGRWGIISNVSSNGFGEEVIEVDYDPAWFDKDVGSRVEVISREKISSIKNVDQESVLQRWHGDKHLLWTTKDGRYYFTQPQSELNVFEIKHIVATVHDPNPGCVVDNKKTLVHLEDISGLILLADFGTDGYDRRRVMEIIKTHVRKRFHTSGIVKLKPRFFRDEDGEALDAILNYYVPWDKK